MVCRNVQCQHLFLGWCISIQFKNTSVFWQSHMSKHHLNTLNFQLIYLLTADKKQLNNTVYFRLLVSVSSHRWRTALQPQSWSRHNCILLGAPVIWQTRHRAHTVRLHSCWGQPGLTCCHGTGNTLWIKPQDNTGRARKFTIKEKVNLLWTSLYCLNYPDAVNPTHSNKVD